MNCKIKRGDVIVVAIMYGGTMNVTEVAFASHDGGVGRNKVFFTETPNGGMSWALGANDLFYTELGTVAAVQRAMGLPTRLPDWLADAGLAKKVVDRILARGYFWTLRSKVVLPKRKANR